MRVVGEMKGVGGTCREEKWFIEWAWCETNSYALLKEGKDYNAGLTDWQDISFRAIIIVYVDKHLCLFYYNAEIYQPVCSSS